MKVEEARLSGTLIQIKDLQGKFEVYEEAKKLEPEQNARRLLSHK